MDHEQDRPENARERLQRRADEETEQRAQARERVRVAQEREKQERRQRAHASRTRATDRPAGRATAAPPAPPEGPVFARPSGPADAPAATLNFQDVVELFNHPLAEGALRRALQALAADVAWRLVPEEDTADRLRCVLLHQPSGARVDVDQERSVVGLWNSRI
jgi:hypothetical protein